MSEKSAISWCDATWNPVVGCTKVLLEPLRWRKPRRVFVNSVSDLFHEEVPDEFLDRVFAVMALTPHITYQVLTKRPERMRAYLLIERRSRSIAESVMLFPFTARQDSVVSDIVEWGLRRDGGGLLPYGVTPWPLPNVWLGTSVEDQERANERVPELLATPAAVRFLSVEPLLEPVDLRCWLPYESRSGSGWDIGGINWVIVGGESGKGARPLDHQWVRSIREQCRAAGVAYWGKQDAEFPHA